jgi:hypothetical protein
MANAQTLPAWWQVAPPHRDIRTRKRLDESIFAADLGEVVRGKAPDDYQDSAHFFAGTFLSAGLSGLLTDVLREMAGTGTGNRIIQIETPFGGGKTHTLLSLYHLFTSPELARNRPEVAALLQGAGLSTVPSAGVATVVGTDLSAAEPNVRPDGTRLHTLWGQLAYQLGGPKGYTLVRTADEERLAPGADALRAVLALGPALILMDELVNYVVPAAGVEVGPRTTLKDQTITFLQQLTGAVAQTPKSVLLLTIPGSQTALYGQAAHDLQQVFEYAGQIAEITGRVQTVRTPVQGDDIYEVLRRRLLDQPATEDERRRREQQARRIAEAYVEMYREIPHDVPHEVQEPSYVERMVHAYPFHPDVVRVLYERWGTLPDFQRTRGALRILGMALANLFAANISTPIVLPSHLDLAPGDLRNELVRVLENPAYNNVLDSDVAGPNAKTAQIDNDLGREHARYNPGVRAATTTFLWSFTGSATETKGATEAQIRVGSLEPGMQPAIIGNVLNEFRRRLWYLHETDSTYRFDTQANLNRVIVQKEEGVSAQTARALVEEQLARHVSDRPRSGSPAPSDARPYVFPRETQDVADLPTLGIVLLKPGQHVPAGVSNDGLPPFVREVMHYYGHRPRTNRNSLVVLVPDTAQVLSADGAAKRLLALRAASNDTQLSLPQHQRDELTRMLRDAEAAFPQECARIYRTVVVPAAQDVGGMEAFDLGVRPFAGGVTVWDDAFNYLSAKERYLTSLAPMLLLSERFSVWPRGAQHVSTQRLWESFVQFPHLPMLSGKQVLTAAIERGATDGVLGYAVGDENSPPFARGRFGSYNTELTVEIAPTSFAVIADYMREHVIPREDPVREISVDVLLHPRVWPQGSQRRSLEEVWRAVTDYYAPRPVDGPHVLTPAIYAAVGEGRLGASIDNGQPILEPDGLDLSRLEARTGVELVRRAPEPVTRTNRYLQIDVADVAPEQLGRIVQGVVRPLNAAGATVILRLVIDADAPDGIDPTLLNLTIKETFHQLGLDPDYRLEGP